MIQIKRLSLKNFKSFKKAEIPIAHGFTAIVGSNGSGKSNILDALLFVLGISSLKALRASRMTDLVNNQSKEEYAKVEMELEEKEKNKKWVISRTIDKQGRSIVRLDDKHVTLGEVSSLLEEFGIKPTGHNIVVQGDITRIMEMNAVQRREMIDDAAGIREFDEKREESLKELQKVDQKIKEVRIVLSERQTYLEELSKERQAALEYNQLSEELKQTKATLFKAELLELEEKRGKNNARKEQLQEELSEKTKKLDEDRNALEEAEKNLEALNQEIISANEKTYSGIGMLVEEKKSEKRVREERKKSFLEQEQKNREKQESVLLRNQLIDTELKEKRKQLTEKEQHLALLEKEFQDAKTAIDEKRKAWNEKSKELKELEKELQEKQSERDEERERLFKRQSLFQALQKTNELRRKSLFELTEEAKRLSERLEQKTDKKSLLDALLKKHPHPEEMLRELQKNLLDQQKKLSYNESQSDSLQDALKLLEKSRSACPTCDAALDAAVQKRIIEEKRQALARLAKENNALSEKRKSLLEERETLEKTLAKKRELELQLADFTELKNQSAELNAKISEIKKELESAATEPLHAEIKENEKRLAALEEETDTAEQSIAGFRKQYDPDAFSKDSEKLEHLSKRLNEEKGQRKQLELETTLVLIEEHKSNHKTAENFATENKALQEKVSAEEKDLEKIQKDLEKLELELAKSEKATKELSEQKTKIIEKITATKERIARSESKLRESASQLTGIEIENSKLEVRETDLKEEALVFHGITTFESFDVKDLRQKVPEIEKRLQKMGAINQKAVEHFGEFEQELLEVKKKSDKLEEERLAVLDMIKKIEDRRTQVFMDCFNTISRHFNEIFFTLADGEGKLSLTNPEQPLESGLLIEARMKGKPIYSIDSMSGGEKTLTGLAFLFAIQMYEPAPFYVFDEADAALDKENSMKLGKIIARISQNGQFIGITHNDTIVREANQIIGVALNEHKSSVVGLRLKEKESDSAQAA